MRQINQQGQTLIEFVVVMPFVVALLLVATYIGFGLYNYHVTASHTRGLHKKLEHYATKDDPLALMKADIANGYTLTKEGGKKFGAQIIKAKKMYAIPGLSFIPPIELVSSTAFPGALFEKYNGSVVLPPPNDPRTPPLGGIGSRSIQFADHPSEDGELFRSELCDSNDYCYGTDLNTGEYATADLAGHYPEGHFGHIADDHTTMTFPGGVFTNASCVVSSGALGAPGADDVDTTNYPFVVPILGGFLADVGGNDVKIHPQCVAYCVQPSVSSTQAEFDACVNPCIAGKLANAKAYVKKHQELAKDNKGCEGETIYEASLPLVE